MLILTVFAQVLLRLSKLCVQEGASGRKSKKQQQRLLRNMGAHSVVLELLQIPYEKVVHRLKKGALETVFRMKKSLLNWTQEQIQSRAFQ